MKKNIDWRALLLGVIVGLLILNSLPRKKLTERNPAEPGLRFLQVDLAFNSNIPEREAWVSEDLERYINWNFIHQEIGICHITETFHGRELRNGEFIPIRSYIEIRGDPWRRLPRRIVATLISQEYLREYYDLVWREDE